MRYFIHLAYSGRNYHGFQVQPDADTIQARMEYCLSKLLTKEVGITGCGRTDTGVNARNFYAHFDIDNEITDTKTLCGKLNSFLPSDIVVFDIFQVSPEAHARFDAVSRTYHYYIAQHKSPFLTDYSYYLPIKLDVESMQQASDLLCGYADFTSFSKLHTQVKTNNCTIYNAKWYYSSDGLLVFDITADRFLRNMVRAIVGTMIEVGRGRLSLEAFAAVVEARDRGRAGYSVPAQGLFLEDVSYKQGVIKYKS